MSVRTLVGATVLAAAAVLARPSIAQEPTLHEVYQAAESGNLAQAQRMMSEVLRAHPNSAKAHYVEAELLAKQGELSAAADELRTAERLEPGLSFARPEAVRELKARVASSRGSGGSFEMPANVRSAGGGIPWGRLLLGAGVIALVALGVGAVLNRRRAAVSTGGVQPYNPTAATQPPATPGSNPAGGGMGSALLGGLVTGAAVGAGMVAGEALAQRLMGGHHGDANVTPPVAEPGQSDLGGSDFGVADGSSWDDGFGGISGEPGGDWS